MPVKRGQIYRSCKPAGPRIRVVSDPITMHGLYGFGKVDVETVTVNGQGVRRRAIEISQLHESGTTRDGHSRRTGYVLVQGN